MQEKSTAVLKASLPSRGAWIEILDGPGINQAFLRRSPPGERGLKSALPVGCLDYSPCRSPPGERGLKCRWVGLLRRPVLSLPSRGAWIEICMLNAMPYGKQSRSPPGERGLKCSATNPKLAPEMSLPSRGAWIEMRISWPCFTRRRSLPSRGAWIEIGEKRRQCLA